MTLQNRECDICEESYKPYREGSKYCSRSCQITGKNRLSKNPNVEKTCEICNTKFVLEFSSRNRRRTCSDKCASMLQLKNTDLKALGRAVSAGKIGKTHKGTPHSEETKKILSQKTGERMRDKTRNPFVGKKRSIESRQKQSKTRSDKIIAGEYSGWFKKGTMTTQKGGVVHFRSSWEEKLAVMLDNDDSVKNSNLNPSLYRIILKKAIE